jgi:hypothetical protein
MASTANTMYYMRTGIVAAPPGGLLPGSLAAKATREAGLTVTTRDRVFMNFMY